MRYIALFFVAALSVGWMLPDLTKPDEAAAAKDGVFIPSDIPQRAASRTDSDEDEAGGWLSSEVALDRESDGHFYADVGVNGQELRFMVDTGATAIALTGADADALGLYWDEDDLVVVGRGVSGDVWGKPVMIDNMQLGSLTVSNVPAAIIPSGLDTSLLGQAFLKQIDNVNISGDRMVLK
ncbi:MAG: TIGR02281 family clan AA aspartic protease [Sphingorhabdus sp.]